MNNRILAAGIIALGVGVLNTQQVSAQPAAPPAPAPTPIAPADPAKDIQSDVTDVTRLSKDQATKMVQACLGKVYENMDSAKSNSGSYSLGTVSCNLSGFGVFTMNAGTTGQLYMKLSSDGAVEQMTLYKGGDRSDISGKPNGQALQQAFVDGVKKRAAAAALNGW